MWSEAGFVTIAGLLAGTIGGWALTAMLVRVLTGVFDPPPDAVTVPWSYLGVIAAVAVLAAVVAAGGAISAACRPIVELLQDL